MDSYSNISNITLSKAVNQLPATLVETMLIYSLHTKARDKITSDKSFITTISFGEYIEDKDNALNDFSLMKNSEFALDDRSMRICWDRILFILSGYCGQKIVMNVDGDRICINTGNSQKTNGETEGDEFSFLLHV
jgi:hypothetical protein